MGIVSRIFSEQKTVTLKMLTSSIPGEKRSDYFNYNYGMSQSQKESKSTESFIWEHRNTSNAKYDSIL